MARKKPQGSRPADDDAALWDRLASTVTPHQKKNRIAPVEPGPPRRLSADPDDVDGTPRGKGGGPTAPRIVQPGPPPPPLPPRAPAALSHGAAPGVDRRTAVKLQRGLMPIDATLDLHGETRSEAQRSLSRFLQAQHAAGARCVLVITGKGLNQGGEGDWTPGVLRTAVPDWLNQPPLRDLVLSFSYAQPKHGGAGALYVLLKRRR